jgi:hypothetical protein
MGANYSRIGIKLTNGCLNYTGPKDESSFAFFLTESISPNVGITNIPPSGRAFQLTRVATKTYTAGNEHPIVWVENESLIKFYIFTGDYSLPIITNLEGFLEITFYLIP